ncbi:MAG: cytochrome P450 [Cyanobacteria bacterium SBLK]|nr:cytochrome P450 [Cyanobacteria bacterium SBLK]
METFSWPVLAIFMGTVGIFGILVGKWWQQKRAYRLLATLPSPPKHWLFGNMLQLSAAVNKQQFSQFLFDWAQKLGPIYILWANIPLVIVSKSHVIETILTKEIKEGTVMRSRLMSLGMNDMTGPVIIGQTGTEWKWRRKGWNPQFNSSGITNYANIINQACQHTIKKIQETPEIQTDFVFVELTMRIISCLLFGIPINPNEDSLEGPNLNIEELYKAQSVLSYRVLRIVSGEPVWMKYLPILRTSREYWAARKTIEDFLYPRVDLALKMRDEKRTDLEGASPLFQKSMLVKIAANTPEYTRATLMSEAFLFLLGGTDSTAHSLAFTIGELTLHPEIFQKAREEVDRVWQSQQGITTESLGKLTYLRAIFKETLRLYTIGSGSGYVEVQREFTIDKQTFPPGVQIFWSILSAGRDPDIYPHPDRFLPERWLDENGKEKVSVPTLVFGSGLHRCLGEHLALLEATIMLALLLRYFDWELINGRASLEQWQQTMFIFPADRMPIRFKAREGVLLS